MGAGGWDYVTPYEGTVEQSLRALQARVFEELYGNDDAYANLEDLWRDTEFMEEEATHSILDIPRVVQTTAPPSEHRPEDYGTLRPLPPDRILHHFGDEKPTPARFEELRDQSYAGVSMRTVPCPDDALLDECRMRWTGVYVVLHTDGRPTHVGIFGVSGD